MRKVMKTRQKMALMALTAIMALMTTMNVQAQVRIGEDSAPTKGAVLDLSSDANGYIGGLKLPNVSITNLNQIPTEFKESASITTIDDKTALTGTLVYNTNTTTGVGVYYWDGTKWVLQVNTTGSLTSTNTALTVANGTNRLVGSDASITVNNTAAIWNANQLQSTPIATPFSPTSNGQVLKWNGAAWAPGTDDNTTYTAGNGLTLNSSNNNAFELGGTLTRPTTIANGGNALTISGTGLTTISSPTTISNSLTYTGSTPVNNYVLKTDGSGNATWVEAGTLLKVTGTPPISVAYSKDANNIGTYNVAVAGGTSGQVLTATGGTNPTATWQTPNVGVTTITGSGPITVTNGSSANPTVGITTGDLTASASVNTATNPLTITPNGTARLVNSSAALAVNNTAPLWNASQLQGKNITTTAPIDGQVLTWNNGTGYWTPTTPATGNFWSLIGNGGTTPGTNFLGTTDDKDLVFKRSGTLAGWLNSSSGNTAFGVSSLPMTSAGKNCTAVGYSALKSVTAGGDNNTAVGVSALSANTGGSTRGNNNNAFGYQALTNNTTGNYNNAFGVGALTSMTTGDHNSAFGNNALNANQTGQYNDAFGVGALAQNKVSNNAAFGSSALAVNTTGTYNAAFGGNALTNNTTGSSNAACGIGALSLSTTGQYNTAVGSGAGGTDLTAGGLVTGDGNVFIGYSTGGTLSKTAANINNNNVFIGNAAGNYIVSGVPTVYTVGMSNNIVIGANGQLASNTASNQISIGNLINASGATGGGNGNVAIGACNSATYKLNVAGTFNANGNISATGGDITATGVVKANGVTLTSDMRYKKNITTISNPLDIVNQLRGTSYEFRVNEFPDKNFKEGKQLGVIAQELEKVLPELVDTDTEGYKSVNYEGIIPVLIEGMKAQQQIIEQLEARVKALEAKK